LDVFYLNLLRAFGHLLFHNFHPVVFICEVVSSVFVMLFSFACNVC